MLTYRTLQLHSDTIVSQSIFIFMLLFIIKNSYQLLFSACTA